MNQLILQKKIPESDLKAVGITRTKKSLVATERLRARVKQRQNDWFRHHIPAMRVHPERLVFIDETSVKTNLTRLHGRSLCGKRLEMDAPFGAWGTQTFIAGLTQDNLIAPWVIKGAMDGEAFEAYIRNVFEPPQSCSRALSSFATTLPPIITRRLRQPCGRLGAGSFTSRRIPPISTPSRWHSQNSKRTCEGSEPEHSTRCSKRSQKSATCSHLTNAGTSFVRLDMDQVKGETL